jgi:hypothetical protein
MWLKAEGCRPLSWPCGLRSRKQDALSNDQSIHNVNVSLSLCGTLCMGQWTLTWCLTGALPMTFQGETEQHIVNRSDWLGTVDCEALEVCIPSPRQWYKFPSKTDLLVHPPQRSTISTISLIISNFYISQNHFLSSVKMQLTQIFTIFAVAIASVAAAPGGGHPPPSPPPPPSRPNSVVQQVLY